MANAVFNQKVRSERAVENNHHRCCEYQKGMAYRIMDGGREQSLAHVKCANNQDKVHSFGVNEDYSPPILLDRNNITVGNITQTY